MNYLGLNLDEFGISVDRDRVEAILKLPRTTKELEVRALLGHLQMLRRFSDDFAASFVGLN